MHVEIFKKYSLPIIKINIISCHFIIESWYCIKEREQQKYYGNI